jgi:hypothetical protein
VPAAVVEAVGAVVVAGTPAVVRRLAVDSPQDRPREERRLKSLLLANQLRARHQHKERQLKGLQLARHRRGGMYLASVQIAVRIYVMNV